MQTRHTVPVFANGGPFQEVAESAGLFFGKIDPMQSQQSQVDYSAL